MDQVMSRVCARIARMREQIINLTCRLVAIPTENPPGRFYTECLDMLQSELAASHLPCEVIDVPGNDAYPRLILISGFGKGQKLFLHGHYDVVLGNHPGQFEPLVQDGRIVGRGTSDMKGAIAAMVCAMKALRSEELNGRIELVLVPDEETGGKLGSGYLSGMPGFGREGIGAVVGEPTSSVVWNASRGAITLRVRVRGKLTHVALQHEGYNAFEGALPILWQLQELKTRVEKRHTSFNISPEAARRSILMLGGEVGGGRQFNTVPDHFSFSIERRFNPEEDFETEKKRLLQTIENARLEWLEVEVEVIQEGESSSTAADSDLGRALAASIEEVCGYQPSIELCPGLLESRIYVRKDVPAMAFGPGILSVSHGPEEYVEVDRLVESAQVYALTAIRLLQ